MNGGNMMFLTNPKHDAIIVDIDGFPSSHWRICLTERPPIPTPKRQLNVDTVLGKLGAFYTKFGWEDMTAKLTFNFLEDVEDFKSFKQQIPYIRAWLENGKVMQFSDEPNVYYLMRNIVINGDINNEMVEYGEFTVDVTLAPFGRVVEDIPVDLTNRQGAIRTPYSIMTYNASSETSYPRFEFVANDPNFSLTVRNVLTGEYHSFIVRRTSTSGVPTGDHTYVIDCENKVFYWLDTDGSKHLLTNYSTTDVFPFLTVGENQISMTTRDSYEANFKAFNMYRNMLR